MLRGRYSGSIVDDKGGVDLEFDAARRITVTESLEKLPGPGGQRFAAVFRHGTLEVEIYAPRGADPQTPHDRDEVYVVAAGTGTFVNGRERMPCAPGDVLFAAAGEVHRFENFSDDFVTWVLFYGPRGGERRHGAGDR